MNDNHQQRSNDQILSNVEEAKIVKECNTDSKFVPKHIEKELTKLRQQELLATKLLNRKRQLGRVQLEQELEHIRNDINNLISKFPAIATNNSMLH